MKNWKIEKMAREIVLRHFNNVWFNSVLLDAFFADSIKQYRGRLIFENKQQTVEFIDLIDWFKDEYGFSGQFVTEVIIEQYDIEELKGVH